MIWDGAGLKCTDRRVEAMAAGMGSVNFTRSGFPVALLAVMVSVSDEPSWPLSVHRRMMSSPSWYCWGPKE